MFDGIRQIGKRLYESRQTARFAANRGSRLIPNIETARDVFDADEPFRMKFMVRSTGVDNGMGTVKLKLTFNPPPPSDYFRCCADCYCTVWETFDLLDEETQYDLQLVYSYVPGSVVMITGNRNFSTQFSEYDPNAGVVRVTTSANLVRIGYVHEYSNCGQARDCGYTDEFQRTIVNSWGKSTSGITWDDQGIEDTDFDTRREVSWGTGKIYNRSMYLSYDRYVSTPGNAYTITVDAPPYIVDQPYVDPAGYLAIRVGRAYVRLYPKREDGRAHIVLQDTEDFTTTMVPGDTYKLKIYADSTRVRIKFWNTAYSEPTTWQSSTNPYTRTDAITITHRPSPNEIMGAMPFVPYWGVREINISGVNSCTV